MADLDQHPAGVKRGDTNIVAMLSLKLLLLGFFILLNALSQYEEHRTRAVLESVNEAFNGQVKGLVSAAPHSAGLGALEGTEAIIDSVGELFTSLIPAVRSEVSAAGRRLRLELPSETLFRPDSVELQPGRELLLKRLARALTRGGRSKVSYEVELGQGVAKGAAARLLAAGARSREIRRVGVLVRTLGRYGVPADKLSVAVLPGRPGRIQFVVQIRDGSPPTVDYRELAE